MQSSPDPLARRIPGESKKANAALRDYAALGVARSLRALLAGYVARAADRSQTKPPTVAWTTLSNWSKRQEWQLRVAAYDAMLRAEADAARRKAVEEMAQRQAALGKDLQEKAAQALALIRLATTEIIEEGGTVIRVVKANLSARDIAALVKVGADLERLSRGEATERVDVVDLVRKLARAEGYTLEQEAEAIALIAAAERIVRGET